MKKIMVVAGGNWQVELVKKAKSMGHYVICSNLYVTCMILNIKYCTFVNTIFQKFYLSKIQERRIP